MKLRGALFGCGMISEFHLLGWNRIPEVEIVALGNRTVSRAEERRVRFAPAAHIYSSLDSMLAAERPDFVDILTPPALHLDHCLAAMRAGVHIICQKPLCSTFRDARRLARAASGCGRLFAVHENHRYRPWFHEVRELHRQGAFGQLSLLRIEHLAAAAPAETYKKEAESGVWLEYGSHLVDMMRSLLGEPERVSARMHHLNPAVRGESLVHAVYDYPCTTAVIETGWKHSGFTQGSVLLAGDQGEAWYEGTLTRGEGGRLRVSRHSSIVSDRAISPLDEYVESFYAFERECTDAMLDRGSIAQTPDEHLKSLACTFAAYEAAASGAAVEIA